MTSRVLLLSVLGVGVVAAASTGAPAPAPVKPVKSVKQTHLCPKCRKAYAPSFRFCERDGAALLTPPAAPSEVTALSGKSAEVVLSWKAAPGVSVVVERKAGGAYVAVGKAVPGADAYTDRTAPPGVKVSYRLRALNAVGGSAYSAEVQALAVPPPPGVPEGVTAKALPGGRISLSWKAGKPGTEFEVQRRNGTLFETVTTTADAKFTDSGLNPETAYAYRIRSVNAGGASDFAAEVGLVSLMAAPATPENLLATAVSQTQVRLEWTDLSTNEEQVLVERKGADGAFVQIAAAEDGSTTFIDGSLQAGARYVYRLRTANKGGYSSYTPDRPVVTLVDGPINEERLPSDPALTMRAVPNRVTLASGEAASVEFQFRYPTAPGQMLERWYAFITPEGEMLYEEKNNIATLGDLPANGSWAWKDRPGLMPGVVSQARNKGFESVILRQSFRGKRADGTVMVWTTSITMNFKAPK